MPTPVEVFLSYSHKDERLLQKLRNHLAPLEQRGFVAAWHDRRIMPGEDWERAISAQLGQCRIILLLISDNFIASDYCNGVEVKTALEKHATGEARVIPIVLSDVA
ncbi:MAG TPA: toll/interleukin-1 receptor domain-containing protein, partial [Gemmatimonadaceae bacterium]|nr:toll/interleukin-1 receptor domain-containing protein [Gemmatimonadaceae bacterium]